MPDSGMIRHSAKRVMVFKYGQTDQSMRDSGKVIWQKVMEDSFLLMVMSTKEIGLTTKLMAKESIFTLKEQHIKEAGSKTSKKVSVGKNGQMVHTMKVPT